MRITNREAKDYVDNLKEFKANNLSAQVKGKYYVVYSYGYWPLYVYDFDSNIWHENEDRYSVTTSKHRGQARPRWRDTVKVRREELDKLINQ